MAKEGHPVAFLVGAFVGGAIGGIVGLMNAPRPGAETWARFAERWHDMEERTAQHLAGIDHEITSRIGMDRPAATTDPFGRSS